MKRYFLTLLIGFAWLGVSCQTNATFNKLDVRGTSHLRGAVDIDTTLHLHGLKAQIIAMNSQYMLILDSATENVYHLRLLDFIDSIGVYADTGFWDRTGNYLYPKTLTDSVGIGTSSPDAGLDVNGNINIPTTTASVGQLKQNGSTILHTYHEQGNNNIFLGYNSGNLTLDSSYNIGIGSGTLSALTVGYKNTSIGYNSLNDLTTGYENIGIGYNSLSKETTGYNNFSIGIQSMENHNFAGSSGGNTAIGNGTLQTSTNCYNNTAVGYGSMFATTAGHNNTGVGYSSLFNNKEGLNNTAIGNYALYSNGDNDGSTAIGYNAMYYADSRTSSERITYNTAVGYEAMRGSTTAANNTGQYNTAVGYEALDAMTSGSYNTAMGVYSMTNVANGASNSAFGYWSLGSLISGSFNTGIGRLSFYNITTSNSNTGLGYQSGQNLATGTYNLALGAYALGNETDGTTNASYNVAIGSLSLASDSTGSNNIAIGHGAGANIESGNGNIFIGHNAAESIDSTASNKLYIENSNSATPLIWGDFATDSLVINGDLTYGDTYWRDATVSGYTLAGGVNAPSLQTFKGAIKANAFNHQTANDIAYGQIQLNHDYKLGTDIEAHVHWGIDQAPAGGNDTVAIAFEYSWSDIDEAFPVPTADTILIVVNSKTELTHYLSELAATITGAGGDGLSSSLIFRIERLQDYSKDTYPSWWFLFDVDFHFQIDSPGSDEELIK